MLGNVGLFKNKQNSKFLNSNKILILQGLVQNNDNIFIINLLNMGDIKAIIPSGVKLGSIHPATVHQSNSSVINSLDYRPETDLTIKEIKE